jgi:signal transduction histidine kinase
MALPARARLPLRGAIVRGMSCAPPSPAVPPRRHWAAFLGRLNARAVAVALLLGTLAAVALNHYFATAFPVLLGRFVFLSMVLLLAFAAAGHWQQDWLPRWLMQVLAVALAAPLATLAIYLLTTGDAAAFFSDSGRMRGFFWISGTGTVLGLVLALGALYRERDAQARSQQLQFELERNTLERQALDARLSLLRSQIEPHFLFNTLANVQALVESGSPRAPAVLGSLIAYLRAAMPRLQEDGSTLGQELALVRAYLELMHMRMPDRLSFTLHVDDALLGRRFPPMVLLTLVENAVRHGIDPSESGGRIEVGAAADAGGLRLWVRDSGIGMAPDAAEGTGLSNLRARLAAFFDDKARLQLDAAEPRGVHAQILIDAP